MKKCEVPGLAGDICKSNGYGQNKDTYCYLLDAAAHEDSRSIRDFEPIVLENASLCPQIDNVILYIEDMKRVG